MDSPQRPNVGSSPSSNPNLGSPSGSKPPYDLQVKMGTTNVIEPVFGCTIDPTARLCKWSAPLSCYRAEGVPEHKLTHKWYRQHKNEDEANKDEMKCSVHPDEVATIQCFQCVKLELPAKGSYHCSSDCYSKAWKKHRIIHNLSREASGETSSVNQLADKETYKCPTYKDKSLDESPRLELNGFEWIEVGSSLSYTPAAEDIGCSLLLVTEVVDCLTDLGLSKGIIQTTPVRNFEVHEPRCMLQFRLNSGDSNLKLQSSLQSSGGVKVSVLTYNLLADQLAHLSQRDYHQWALSWEYRQQKLLKEMIDYNADILCLQEVQSNHLERFFIPKLEKHGYSVIYKMRRFQLYGRHGYCNYGCATFYRRDVFKIIAQYERAFDSSVSRVLGELVAVGIGQRDETFQRLKKGESDSSIRRLMEALEALEPRQRYDALNRLNRDNVALVVILEKLESEGNSDITRPRICVANTHIYSGKEYPDVKLFQVVDLITGLDKFAEMKIPLLVCGDFNSLPLSEPYRFITSGRLDNIPSTGPLGTLQHLKPQHSLRLRSTYASFYNSDGIKEEERKKFNPESAEPLFTHWTSEFTGTLDYIFYTEDSLMPDGVLELLDIAKLAEGLPSNTLSSDHIALMARFVIIPTISQQGSQTFPPDLWS